MTKKAIKAKNKYDWLEFAQSFLLLARLACQELEDTQTKKHSKTTRHDQGVDFPYSETDLFIPIVFNIKHGIEVFIKTLRIISIGDYEEGHDLKDLFKDLKQVLPLSKIKQTKDGRGNEITQEDIDNMPGNIAELEGLTLKYYHCEFIRRGKKLVNIYDKTNDIFRYPNNKAEVKIDLGLVDESIIRSVHEDIDKMYRLFNDLGYLLEIHRTNRGK